MYSIKTTNLTKTYPNHVVANDDINLTIKEGEFFCVLGPNGAGKSTLVKQITGEMKPTKGSVKVLGIDVFKNPVEAKSRMGIMPQECSLYEHLTVGQHINIFSRLKKVALRNAHEIVDCLKLEQYQDKKIGELSFGLKRQVLLATALLGSPSVMILDEPTTGLDPEARLNVWNLLNEKTNSGTTILLTTHLFEEAEFLSDCFGVIVQGRLVYSGTIDSLRSTTTGEYEVKYRNGMNGSSQHIERFENLNLATSFLKQLNDSEFSLSTLSLESVYFDLLKGNK